MLLFKEIIPGIKRLESPFGESWSGIILIKDKENILIDSGASAQVIDECLVPALGEEGLRPGDIHWLLNTHAHGDHIGGHYRFSQISNAKIAAFAGSAEKMRNPLKYSKLIRSVFPEFSPPPPPVLEGVEPDVLLEDGDCICGRMKLLHTPGHDNDCVCWFDTQSATLISGDSLQANGTTLQGCGFYQDLSGYRKTLKGLRKMDIKNIVAGHFYRLCGSRAVGEEESVLYLEKCLYLIDYYGILIAEIVDSGVTEPSRIAVQFLKQLDLDIPEFLFLTLYTVCEHLKEESNA